MAHARLEHLLTAGPAVIYSCKPDGDYGATFISANITSQLGWRPEDFTAESRFWADHIHPEDGPRVLSDLSQILEQGHHTHEYRFQHKDGGYHWMRDELRLVRGTRGNALEIVGCWVDISQRKAAEEALRRSEEHYRAVVEAQTELVARWLPDTTITFVNEAVCRYLGKPREELLGASFLPFVLEEDREKMGQYIASLGPANPIGTVEHREIDALGKVRWFQWTDRAILDEHGQVVEFQAVGRDITALKETEGKLRALAGELARAEERAHRRIASLLHDQVSQPLVIAKMSLAALRQPGSSQLASEGLGKAQELLGEALEASRSLTFELSPPVLHELGLPAALEWVVERFSERHGLEVQARADAGIGKVTEEVRGFLFGAARELLLNVVRHARAASARVILTGAPGTLTLVVEDDGVGFAATAGGVPWAGGGFGLFSLNERAADLGGRLHLEAAPGGGARVALTVPAGAAGGDVR